LTWNSFGPWPAKRERHARDKTFIVPSFRRFPFARPGQSRPTSWKQPGLEAFRRDFPRKLHCWRRSESASSGGRRVPGNLRMRFRLSYLPAAIVGEKPERSAEDGRIALHRDRPHVARDHSPSWWRTSGRKARKQPARFGNRSVARKVFVHLVSLGGRDLRVVPRLLLFAGAFLQIVWREARYGLNPRSVVERCNGAAIRPFTLMGRCVLGTKDRMSSAAWTTCDYRAGSEIPWGPSVANRLARVTRRDRSALPSGYESRLVVLSHDRLTRVRGRAAAGTRRSKGLRWCLMCSMKRRLDFKSLTFEIGSARVVLMSPSSFDVREFRSSKAWSPSSARS